MGPKRARGRPTKPQATARKHTQASTPSQNEPSEGNKSGEKPNIPRYYKGKVPYRSIFNEDWLNNEDEENGGETTTTAPPAYYKGNVPYRSIFNADWLNEKDGDESATDSVPSPPQPSSSVESATQQPSKMAEPGVPPPGEADIKEELEDEVTIVNQVVEEEEDPEMPLLEPQVTPPPRLVTPPPEPPTRTVMQPVVQPMVEPKEEEEVILPDKPVEVTSPSPPRAIVAPMVKSPDGKRPTLSVRPLSSLMSSPARVGASAGVKASPPAKPAASPAAKVPPPTKPAVSAAAKASPPARPEVKSPPLTYDCKKCHIKYPTRREFVEHCQEKHEFLCSICSRIFQAIDDLNAHMPAHMNPYKKCSVCSFSCSDVAGFKTHLSSHIIMLNRSEWSMNDDIGEEMQVVELDDQSFSMVRQHLELPEPVEQFQPAPAPPPPQMMIPKITSVQSLSQTPLPAKPTPPVQARVPTFPAAARVPTIPAAARGPPLPSRIRDPLTPAQARAPPAKPPPKPASTTIKAPQSMQERRFIKLPKETFMEVIRGPTAPKPTIPRTIGSTTINKMPASSVAVALSTASATVESPRPNIPTSRPNITTVANMTRMTIPPQQSVQSHIRTHIITKPTLATPQRPTPAPPQRPTPQPPQRPMPAPPQRPTQITMANRSPRQPPTPIPTTITRMNVVKPVNNVAPQVPRFHTQAAPPQPPVITPTTSSAQTLVFVQQANGYLLIPAAPGAQPMLINCDPSQFHIQGTQIQAPLPPSQPQPQPQPPLKSTARKSTRPTIPKRPFSPEVIRKPARSYRPPAKKTFKPFTAHARLPSPEVLDDDDDEEEQPVIRSSDFVFKDIEEIKKAALQPSMAIVDLDDDDPLNPNPTPTPTITVSETVADEDDVIITEETTSDDAGSLKDGEFSVFQQQLKKTLGNNVNAKTFRCGLCKSNFLSTVAVYQHMRRQHAQQFVKSQQKAKDAAQSEVRIRIKVTKKQADGESKEEESSISTPISKVESMKKPSQAKTATTPAAKPQPEVQKTPPKRDDDPFLSTVEKVQTEDSNIKNGETSTPMPPPPSEDEPMDTIDLEDETQANRPFNVPKPF